MASAATAQPPSAPHVAVKLGNRTFHVCADDPSPDALRLLPVRDVLAQLAGATGIPAESLRLIARGGTSSPLSPLSPSSSSPSTTSSSTAPQTSSKKRPARRKQRSSASGSSTAPQHTRTTQNQPQKKPPRTLVAELPPPSWLSSLQSWLWSSSSSNDVVSAGSSSSSVFLDPNKTLGDYGIKNKTTLMLMPCDKPTRQHNTSTSSKTDKKPRHTQSTTSSRTSSRPSSATAANEIVTPAPKLSPLESSLKAIDTVRDDVSKSIIPHITELEQLCDAIVKDEPCDDIEARNKKLKMLHALCSDMLEKATIKLDAVQLDDATVRDARRAAIKEIQARLSHVDECSRNAQSKL